MDGWEFIHGCGQRSKFDTSLSSTPWLAYINWAAVTHLLGIRGYGAWPGSDPRSPVELRGRVPDQRTRRSSAPSVVGIAQLSLSLG